MKNLTILGIDPGSHRIGFGLVEKSGRDLCSKNYGTIEFRPGQTADRLALLEKEIEKLVKKNKPSAIAIEKLYFSKNRKTALSVAESRGVIMLAARKSGAPVLEYDPTTVKQRITGYGMSDKKAVLKMVKIFLRLKDFAGLDDASDALAIAIVACLDNPGINS
ncbi:MAG: crossover junction endodeoxyribonuclease RuvC [Patescibacteria group bacterium]|nr:crossover junction endodeoxyribonuclease RuvC [Patescibacteria group bacterium]MCL5262168.1 crossover junction endodeoxyribonuclease RuvC [Patescibacteria group bacterium]